MIFVPVSAGRVEVLIKLEQAASQYPWTDSMLDGSLQGKAECCEIQLNGALIGYWLVQRVLGEAELLNFVIFKPYQAQSFGSKALAKLKLDLQKQTIENLFLEVRESNLAARKLYEKTGFDVINRRPDYYHTDAEDGGKENALLMRCVLGAGVDC